MSSLKSEKAEKCFLKKREAEVEKRGAKTVIKLSLHADVTV